MSAAAPGRRAPGWVLPVALVLAGVALLVLVGRSESSDEPLHPRSHERLGTSALVALLRELGAEVDITTGLPGEGTDVYLVLTDRFDEAQSEEVVDWVERGGTLVVVDPGSPLTPVVGERFTGGTPVEAAGSDSCEVDGLDALDDVRPRNGGVLYDVPAGADGCLGARFAAHVVVEERGGGTLVSVGGSGLFVNAALAEGDNAPVAAALVAPERGTSVAVLEPGPVIGGTGGDDTLGDLVSPNVRRFLAQLAVAFVVFALWRARRLGAPVDEPQPVAVAGSELVSAVGALLDRAGSPQHAADLLRADLHRFLGDRLGLPAGAPPDVVAAVAHARIGADRDRVAWALGPTPVADDEQLVALAQTIDRIREEVLDHV